MTEPAFAADSSDISQPAADAVTHDDHRYRSLLADCARGEQQALKTLYEIEGGRLLGVILRIVRERAWAEDLLHDAFMKIWRRAATFDATRGSARGWIYTVARNLALNAMRDRQAHEQGVSDDQSQRLDDQASLAAWNDTQDAYAQVAWADSAGRVGHCLEQLEPVRRNCVLHAYVDGLTHREIASRLGAPLGTVKAWIKRSLLALRECLA